MGQTRLWNVSVSTFHLLKQSIMEKYEKKAAVVYLHHHVNATRKTSRFCIYCMLFVVLNVTLCLKRIFLLKQKNSLISTVVVEGFFLLVLVPFRVFDACFFKRMLWMLVPDFAKNRGEKNISRSCMSGSSIFMTMELLL